MCAWMYVCMHRPLLPTLSRTGCGEHCSMHSAHTHTHKVTSRCDRFCDQWRPLQLPVVPRQRTEAPSDHPQTVALGPGSRCACHHAGTHAPRQHETSHVLHANCRTGRISQATPFGGCGLRDEGSAAVSFPFCMVWNPDCTLTQTSYRTGQAIDLRMGLKVYISTVSSNLEVSTKRRSVLDY